MISKAEYFYMKGRLEKMENAVFQYQINSDVHVQWQELKTIPLEEKNRRMEEWSYYYQTVRNSPIGLLMREMAQACNFGSGANRDTLARVRAIVTRAEGALNETNRILKKPKHGDPAYIEYKISAFQMLQSEVIKTKLLLGEYRDAYEKTKPSGGI